MKKTVIALLCMAFLFSFSGCAQYDFSAAGEYVVTPKEALSLQAGGAVLVDVQSAQEYAAAHIEGAINIPMEALTVAEPYANTVAPEEQIASAMSAAGVRETDTLLLYDNNANMQAARVQWTLNLYGNFNVKVISGGLKHLENAGASVSTTPVTLSAAEYKTGEKQKKLLVTIDYIKMLIDKPDASTIIIDARTAEEYAAGTIPGAVNIDYALNNYPSGEYKSSMDLQSTYLNKGIVPGSDLKLVVFCKSGVRAAQTYTALKDAGYADVRVYDGSYTEYGDIMGTQAEPPSTAPVAPTQGDAS